MPTYDYVCEACDHKFELFQSIKDDPIKKCPECGKGQLQKLVSAPSFRLAGGGWYETDFKTDKDKKRNLVEAEKSEAKADKPEAKPETKSETKPEKKEEAKAKPDAKPAASAVKPAAKRRRKA